MDGFHWDLTSHELYAVKSLTAYTKDVDDSNMKKNEVQGVIKDLKLQG